MKVAWRPMLEAPAGQFAILLAPPDGNPMDLSDIRCHGLASRIGVFRIDYQSHSGITRMSVPVAVATGEFAFTNRCERLMNGPHPRGVPTARLSRKIVGVKHTSARCQKRREGDCKQIHSAVKGLRDCPQTIVSPISNAVAPIWPRFYREATASTPAPTQSAPASRRTRAHSLSVFPVVETSSISTAAACGSRVQANRSARTRRSTALRLACRPFSIRRMMC